MLKVTKKKLVLLMLMLLSVFTLFVACGEEEDDDDDEKSARTIKNEENKDLQNLDTVYVRINEALCIEDVYIECSKGMTATKLSDILDSDSKLGEELKETIGQMPKLSADCNKGADIYVEIVGEKYNVKVRVFCATSPDGEPTVCEETEDADGNLRKMEMPNNYK